MYKLLSLARANWLSFVKTGVVLSVLLMAGAVVYQSFWVYQERGKELGKIEMASVEEIPAFYGIDRLKNVRSVVSYFAPDQPADKRTYNWPAKSIYEFVEFKSRNLVYQDAFDKAALEADTAPYENFMGLDIRHEREKLQNYLTAYTIEAEKALGHEQTVTAWQKHVDSQSEVITGKKYYSDKVQTNWSTVWLWGLIAFGISVFLAGVYNICKLKSQGMKIWCEVANFRLPAVSSLFFLTLIVDAYPLHSAVDQLKTVRRTCAMLLSFMMSLGAAVYGQSSGNTGSNSSTKQKTDYALIIENRTSVAINGRDPKPEVAMRVLFTTPGGIFVEDLGSYRKGGRITNSLIVGKWFDASWAARLGKLRLGPYGGWRYTDAPNIPREDSVVGGSKVSFVKPVTKDKNLALNVIAPTLQVERSVQRKTWTFATAIQAFGSWKKQGINLGGEFLYRKTQGRTFSGYVGPIFAKKLASGKGFLKSLYGEVGLFREIPIGDWRFRGRLTLQL